MPKPMTIDEVLATEFSERFVKGMRDRMVVSYHKYGPLVLAYPDKVSALQSLSQRLDKYRETGNTEWLMDVANFAMIEFMRPSHPQAHFRGTDAHESPGRIDVQGEVSARTNQATGDNLVFKRLTKAQKEPLDQP